MRIEAVKNTIPIQTSYSGGNDIVKPRQDDSANVINSEVKSNDTYSYKELVKKSKYELSIDESAWIRMIERANKAITGAICNFEYSIHEGTREIMVKVIDRDTKEVIREIPPEKILDMVAKLWEMAGILVDERR